MIILLANIKYYKNGNNGLSGGAIAGIIISIVVVAIASVLAILINKGKLIGRKTHVPNDSVVSSSPFGNYETEDKLKKV